MNQELKNNFIRLWKQYFNDAELPVTFYYTDNDAGDDFAEKPKGRSCLIGELIKVRKGRTLAYNSELLVCGGAKRSLGYIDKMRPGFEFFLSCGNENIEGERYLRNPELVRKFLGNQRKIPAEHLNIVFKRWDKLTVEDEPLVVIFFAQADVISGLFTLANFDQEEPNGTITPFGSGCAQIVNYPYFEAMSDNPRAVIGMFDPSARAYIKKDLFSFAVPLKKFVKMILYMEESFLITDTWETIKKRI